MMVGIFLLLILEAGATASKCKFQREGHNFCFILFQEFLRTFNICFKKIRFCNSLCSSGCHCLISDYSESQAPKDWRGYKQYLHTEHLYIERQGPNNGQQVGGQINEKKKTHQDRGFQIKGFSLY